MDINTRIAGLANTCSSMLTSSPSPFSETWNEAEMAKLIEQYMETQIRKKLVHQDEIMRKGSKYFTADECVEQLEKLKDFQDESLFRKRGRPIKNIQSQKKLAEWIRNEGRPVISKKQIDYQYSLIFGRQKRNIPIHTLNRILKIYGLEDIKISRCKSSEKPKQKISQKVCPIHLKQEEFHDQLNFLCQQENQQVSLGYLEESYDINRYLNLSFEQRRGKNIDSQIPQVWSNDLSFEMDFDFL